MSNFGEFLYTLRKEKGMTQAELAETLGVTNKAVSKWETGESMPETSLLLPLSRIFGVTVDELLSGKRADRKYTDGNHNDENRQEKENKEYGYSQDGTFNDSVHIDCEKTADGEHKRKFVRVKRGDTVITVEADDLDDLHGLDLDDLKDLDELNINGHIFHNHRTEKQTRLDKICGAICASIMMLGIIAYLLVGGLTNAWHPYWLIIAMCGLASGVIGAVFDALNPAKREQKIRRGENPYVGAACAVCMLVCVAVYIIVGVTTGLWHPLWVIPAVGGVACGAIGAIGNAIMFKNKDKDKE